MEVIDPKNICIAKCPQGLEEVLEKELKELGAKHTNIVRRAVSFKADKKTIYKINLHSRLSSKILVPIGKFYAKHPEELYKKMKQLDWSKVLKLEQTFAVMTTVHSEYFNHSQYIALKAKDAIVDQFYAKVDDRPNVDPKQPNIKIHIHIFDKECTVYLDSSGDALFKRGYRIQSGPAPINEVLAAGMLALSEWNEDIPLIDPMCGSGTIVIEAAMMATNTPANILREEFGFMNWPDYDDNLWEKVKEEAFKGIKPSKAQIFGYDKTLSVLRFAEENAEEVSLEEMIQFKRKDFMHLEPPVPGGMIVTNPPYDERIKVDETEAFYKAIGDRFKQVFQGYTAWLISSNMAAVKRVGLRPSRKIGLFNGKLECKYLKYDLYSGSKKAKYANQD